LDGELVDAMRDGLVLRCPDGHSRCFYPRIFTYSADYPEKWVVLLSISRDSLLTLSEQGPHIRDAKQRWRSLSSMPRQEIQSVPLGCSSRCRTNKRTKKRDTGAIRRA
jgi:hypothetical protein